MLTKEKIEKWKIALDLVDDISITHKIDSKKAKNAIKTYGQTSLLQSDLLLLIDNTVLRSAKQGMFLTNTHLFAYSAYSGKFSIPVKDIKTVQPGVEHPLKSVPVFGFSINSEYFVSLPGSKQMVYAGDQGKTGLEILIGVMAAIMDFTII